MDSYGGPRIHGEKTDGGNVEVWRVVWFGLDS